MSKLTYALLRARSTNTVKQRLVAIHLMKYPSVT